MGRPWHYLAFFLVVAVVAGTVDWLRSDEADWWAYVDLPNGRLPKFKLTWLEQLAVCFVIGSLIAAPATLAVWGLEVLWTRRSSRFSQEK